MGLVRLWKSGSAILLLLVLIIVALVAYIMTHQQTRPASLNPFSPRWNQPHALDIDQPGTSREEKEEEERSEEEQEAIRGSRPADQPNTKVADKKSRTIAERSQNPVADAVLASRNANGWAALNCDPDVQLRKVTLKSPDGEFTMYIYNSSEEDASATKRALKGQYFERNEIAKFLKVSNPLPIIDVGANLGLVTLQAAKKGRRVVAVEPAPMNALRLCRSVVDFGHAPLVRVIQNAVSSREGRVSLVLPESKAKTRYELRTGVEDTRTASETAFAIWLDRLVDLLPFSKAALKIDVEGHEGHVVAKADRLFREVDIAMVWMEWQHVKGMAEFGGAFVMKIMKKHSFVPYSLMTGQRLSYDKYMSWPFTVLWKKSA